MSSEYVEHKQQGRLLRHSEAVHQANGVFDWMIRRYFPEEVERLKGDADEIIFHKITFNANEMPKVEYSTRNET